MLPFVDMCVLGLIECYASCVIYVVVCGLKYCVLHLYRESFVQKMNVLSDLMIV